MAGTLLKVDRLNPDDVLDKATAIVFPDQKPELAPSITRSRMALVGRLLLAERRPSSAAA